MHNWFKRIPLTILALLCFSMPTFAQESTPDPNPPDQGSDILDDIREDTGGFVDNVISGLDNLIAPYIAVAIPLVMILVQLAKPLVPSTVSADLLKRVFSVIVWGVFIFFARAGYADQFNNLVPALATILATITGVVATSEGSSVAYQAVSSFPVIGYSRTPETD